MTRIAVALGSGGARGYAHIGVIRALQRRGHEFVGVAGSSMGAVVGGALAAGKLEAFAEWVLGLSRSGVLRQLDPSLTPDGVIRAERVLTSMADFVGGRRIEDLPVRFTAVAVDLLAGSAVWIDEGPLDRAIRASIGIPGAFTPTVLNGRLLVDGGVLAPVPVAAAAGMGAEAVVAVSLHGEPDGMAGHGATKETADRRPVPGWWARLRTGAEELLDPGVLAALPRPGSTRGSASAPEPIGAAAGEAAAPRLSMADVLRLSLAAAERELVHYALAAYPPDILVEIPKNACRPMDFHRAADMIELGERLAEQALDSASTPGR